MPCRDMTQATWPQRQLVLKSMMQDPAMVLWLCLLLSVQL